MRRFKLVLSGFLKTAGGLGILIVVVGATTPAHAQLDPPDLWDPIVLPNVQPVLENGAAAWGDFDADGDLDLFYTGFRSNAVEGTGPYAQLYLNDGASSVVLPNGDEISIIDYAPVLQSDDNQIRDFFYLWRSSVAWGDYDGDGKVDLATTGISDDGSRLLRIYRNTYGEASGDFLQLRFSLPGLSDGDLEWGDWNQDGSLDLILSGLNDVGIAEMVIVQNMTRLGQGFTFLSSPALEGLRNSSLSWGDYDNDMDLDLIATGVTDSGRFSTILYQNQDGTTLTDSGFDLPALLNGSVAFGDGDADGDLDILMTGAEIGPFLVEGQVLILENNSGSFSSTGATIDGLFGQKGTGRYAGQAEWGDFDNDGYSDFFVSGFETPTSIERGRTYQSRGGLEFTYSSIGFRNGSFLGGGYGTVTWGDYDNDGDLDLLSYGRDQFGIWTIRVFQNYLPFYPRNQRPQPPGFLETELDGSTVELSWQPGHDGGLPPDGLTYNVRMGTSPGSGDIMAPNSALATGNRLITGMGNAGHNLGWRITHLEPGTYYWTVQTIDTSFKGSEFSVEQSFTVSGQ